jgi:hypothetical protein
MTRAETDMQIQELKPGLDALRGSDPLDFKPLVWQNLKNNLKGLNFHMSVIGLKLQQPANLKLEASAGNDSTRIDPDESVIPIKALNVDHIVVSDSLGHDQVFHSSFISDQFTQWE